MGTADNLSDPAAAQSRDGDDAGAAASLQELLARGRSRLAARGAAALDAELLLAHVLGRPRSYLLAHREQLASAAAAAAFHDLLDRAAAGEPLAYLTGEREFWSLPLQVTAAVLVPRPETELAVERCLALLAATPVAPVAAPAVCDLGTGSGAIALALASERPDWHLTATDRSAAALQVARGNAARLHLSGIEFVQGDWFGPLAGRRFELLVCNPPYIAAGDPALQELRHEPAAALTPGPTGLEALIELIRAAPAHLASGGWLVLEHGADQRESVAGALVGSGFTRVRCHQDLAGHDRVTEARWPDDTGSP